MNSFGWCTVESDPAVFTEMLENFGVSGVVVNEIVSLEEGILKSFSKIFGVILLFKWKKPPASLSSGDNFDSNTLYFARQVVNNACATQAILNTILNFPKEIELGKELSNFLDFTAGLDPEMRGEMVGQSEVIRSVHNSFSRPATFAFEDIKSKDDDDVYHFTSFIFKNGGIYELDGLKPGPVKICSATSESWQNQMIDTINGRMQEISVSDKSGTGQGISFSLLVINEDKIPILRKKINAAMSEEKPCDELVAELEEAIEQKERGRQENVRRRHNYIPAVVELLRALADKGKLKGCIEATQKHAAAQSKRSEEKNKVEEF